MVAVGDRCAGAAGLQPSQQRIIDFEGVDDCLVYGPGPMTSLIEKAETVARHDIPVVLLLGESGTGKQLIARLLHERSPRRAGPFVEINASTVPESLAESELFGHEQGAFSDARGRKLGLVELAQGGTLFLDEVGDLAPPNQAKLLTFLESRTFRRLGCTVPRRVDARVVAATNRDLPAMVQGGRFRLDLWYRLDSIVLHLPPLRERGGVVELAEYFLLQASREHHGRLRGIAPATAALLERHPWPGNVRELRSVMRRAALLADSELLLPEHLPPGLGFAHLVEARGAPAGGSRIRALAEVELAYIREVLAHCGDNRTLAAKHLGITRQTLTRRLAEAGVDPALLGDEQLAPSLDELSVPGPLGRRG